MNLQRLREETRAEHEATEATLPLTEAGLTMEGYAAALRALLPVVEGWEMWAAEHAPSHLLALLPERRRSHLLRRDLETLGLPKAVTGQSDAARAVDWEWVTAGAERPVGKEAREAGFLGALYVMEGSTLGGRYIARSVEAAFGMQPGQGDAYFQGHGERTGSLWRETTAAIANTPDAQSELVVAAAKRTFEAFGAAVRAALDACDSQIVACD